MADLAKLADKLESFETGEILTRDDCFQAAACVRKVLRGLGGGAPTKVQRDVIDRLPVYSGERLLSHLGVKPSAKHGLVVNHENYKDFVVRRHGEEIAKVPIVIPRSTGKSFYDREAMSLSVRHALVEAVKIIKEAKQC